MGAVPCGKEFRPRLQPSPQGPVTQAGPSPTKGSSADHSREHPRVKHLQVWKKEPPNQGSLGPAGHRSLRDREGGKGIQEK